MQVSTGPPAELGRDLRTPVLGAAGSPSEQGVKELESCFLHTIREAPQDPHAHNPDAQDSHGPAIAEGGGALLLKKHTGPSKHRRLCLLQRGLQGVEQGPRAHLQDAEERESEEGWGAQSVAPVGPALPIPTRSWQGPALLLKTALAPHCALNMSTQVRAP